MTNLDKNDAQYWQNNDRSKKSIDKIQLRNIRHSYRVKKIRKILPIITMCLIGIVVSWSLLSSLFEAKIEKIPESNMSTNTKGEVLNPSFLEKDNRGNPFKISASRATRLDNNNVSFTLPEGTLVTDDASIWRLKAREGELDTTHNSLKFIDDVVFSTSDGLQILGMEITFNTQKMHLNSEQSVQIISDKFTMNSAGGFFASKNKGYIRFDGQSTIIVKP